MSPFSALLFDLDGTLIDSAPDIGASLNKALMAMGRPTIGLDDVKSLVGFNAPTLVEKALAMTGPAGGEEESRRLLADFLDTYRRHPCDHTVLFDGVRDALERFAAAGVRLGLCTNKPEVTCYPVLEALDLKSYFTAIVCGDTLDYRKPDPRHVLHTLAAVGAEPGDAAFVGDNEIDMEAATGAGLPGVCVTFGYCHRPYDSLGAAALIDHFGDLDRALGEIAASRSA